MELAPLQRAFQRSRFRAEATGGQYQNLDQDDEDGNGPAHGETEGPQETQGQDPEKRSWGSALLIQIPLLSWLAPILVLLYLNLHGHIIGASAWCPNDKCKLDLFNPASSIPEQQLAKYDRASHNLLGTLQVVAKALEVWFIFIAGWLVYNLATILASRPHGLQLAYITRPTEFAEIPAMFDPVLWQALPPLRSPSRGSTVDSTGDRRGAKWRVWVFVIFTVCLGILCNLIGPAVAVLVIPALQWQDTSSVGNQTFMYIGAESRPGNHSLTFVTSCTSEQLSAQKYSCAAWNNILDGWLQSCLSTTNELGATTQEQLSFGVNSTSRVNLTSNARGSVISWAPNRLLLHSLSQDWYMLSQISQGIDREKTLLPDLYDTYLPYQNAIQTYITRNGPILGAVANMWVGYNDESISDTIVNQDSILRCFQNYNLSHTPLFPNSAKGTFTKCVTLGKGWNLPYDRANFTILGLYKPWLANGHGPSINFEIFTSGKAAFLPGGEVPNGFDPRCIAPGPIAPGVSCDWDLFFTTQDPDLAIRSRKVTTIQMTTLSAPLDRYPEVVSFAVDFVTWFNFTQYSLDPAPETNPNRYVTTPRLPIDYATQVNVNPAWILAAYGVDNGGIVGANSSSAIALQNVLQALWAAYPYLDQHDPITSNRPKIDCAAIIPVLHALSIVDYTTNATHSDNQLDHPPLRRSGRIYVWAYGISSRTAYFGVVTTCIAMVIVILESVLAVRSRTRLYNPTQLIAAALEYKYSADFTGMEHSEKSIAKVPFRVNQVEHAASEFAFSRVD